MSVRRGCNSQAAADAVRHNQGERHRTAWRGRIKGGERPSWPCSQHDCSEIGLTRSHFSSDSRGLPRMRQRRACHQSSCLWPARERKIVKPRRNIAARTLSAPPTLGAHAIDSWLASNVSWLDRGGARGRDCGGRAPDSRQSRSAQEDAKHSRPFALTPMDLACACRCACGAHFHAPCCQADRNVARRRCSRSRGGGGGVRRGILHDHEMMARYLRCEIAIQLASGIEFAPPSAKSGTVPIGWPTHLARCRPRDKTWCEPCVAGLVAVSMMHLGKLPSNREPTESARLGSPGSGGGLHGISPRRCAKRLTSMSAEQRAAGSAQHAILER